MASKATNGFIRRRFVTLLLTVSLFFGVCVDAVTINMRKAETRCLFLTGFSENMQFTGQFQVKWWPNNQMSKEPELAPEDFGLFVEVTETATKNTVVAKSFKNTGPGRFTFNCEHPMKVTSYEICLSVDSYTFNNLLKNYRHSLRIEYLQFRKYEDKAESDASLLAKAKSIENSKSTVIEFLLENVQFRIGLIQEEQQRWYDVENIFREKSQDLNDFILYWSFINLSAVFVIGLYQIYHMKNFFIKKKIV